MEYDKKSGYDSYNRPPASGLNYKSSRVAGFASFYDRTPQAPPLDEIPVYSPDDEPPPYTPPPQSEHPSSSAAAASKKLAKIELPETELPPMSSINTDSLTEMERISARSSLKTNLKINVALLFLGPIFLCALPCCLGVMLVYCIALKKYHSGDYVGSDNILNKGTYCFIFWIFTSVVGGVAFLIAIAYVLAITF